MTDETAGVRNRKGQAKLDGSSELIETGQPILDGFHGIGSFGSSQPSNCPAEVESKSAATPLATVKLELLAFVDVRTDRPDVSIAPQLRSSGKLTVTKLWSYEQWELYWSEKRWWYALVEWPHSTVLKRTSKPILFILCFTLAALFLNRVVLPGSSLTFTLPMAPLTLSGGSLALLLVFHTNQAYDRLKEARTSWGALVLRTKETMQLLVAYCKDDADEEALVLIARLLAVYGWILRARLTATQFGLGDDEDALRALLPQQEAEWLLDFRVQARHSAVLLRLRCLLGKLHSSGSLSDVPLRCIEEKVSGLGLVGGACERLFSSPIGPTYTRHSLRALLLWLFALPLALDSLSLVQQLISVAATAYIMLGIHEIANQVEQPFAVLPLQQLAIAATRGVAETLTPIPSCGPEQDR
jgi:ion channel-forming bestrophin family protein